MAHPESSQPLEMKVNPRKWTTQVNLAVVIGVAVILLIGLIYGMYAASHQGEVHQDVHEEVTPGGSAP